MLLNNKFSKPWHCKQAAEQGSNFIQTAATQSTKSRSLQQTMVLLASWDQKILLHVQLYIIQPGVSTALHLGGTENLGGTLEVEDPWHRVRPCLWRATTGRGLNQLRLFCFGSFASQTLGMAYSQLEHCCAVIVAAVIGPIELIPCLSMLPFGQSRSLSLDTFFSQVAP